MKKQQARIRRCVLYCRVASNAQFGDMEMEAQSAALHEQAAKMGAVVAGEVRAYEKGVTLDRKGWQDALRLAARERADAVMVRTLDRIARGTLELLDARVVLERSGLSIYTCDSADALDLHRMKKVMEAM